MNDGLALLAAICEHPDDDTPRLVFADYLEEIGEDARGEFIRLQVGLGRLGGPKAPLTLRMARLYATGQAKAVPTVDRVATLLSEHGTAWCLDLGTDPAAAWEWGWHRGFVEHWVGSAADWLRIERLVAWPPAAAACRACGGTGEDGGDVNDRGMVGWCMACYDAKAGTSSGSRSIPRPTDPCPGCEGNKTVRTVTWDPASDEYRETGIKLCNGCRNADKVPTGRVARPWTGTAVPLVAVTLTTGLRFDYGYTTPPVLVAGDASRPCHLAAASHSARTPVDVLREEWPWLRFALPPPPDTYAGRVDG